MDAVADTTLLVGLWRRQPWAVDFAHANTGLSLGLPWVVLGEFWHGAMRAGHPADQVGAFLTLGIPLVDTSNAVPAYARICVALQSRAPQSYAAIGQNDLWIAAAALAEGKPLITRNRRHFGAIPDLHLEVLEPDGPGA